MNHPDDATHGSLEQLYSEGISSAKLLATFKELGIHFSESSLRKYVQLGLLPRSVRVGKGTHRGSEGLYPASVLRQVVRIKQMMAQSYTIEQIQRDFFFVQGDLEKLASVVDGVLAAFHRVMSRQGRGEIARDLSTQIDDARLVAQDLMKRLSAIESRLVTRAQVTRIPSST